MQQVLSDTITAFPFTHQVIFEINGFTAELCRNRESLENAFRLRYRSYRNAEIIGDLSEGMLYDKEDFMPHTFVHLIWHENKPVGTVRSSIYSDDYDWTTVQSVKYFPEKIKEKPGESTRFLESNRYAVDPDFQGRKSLFAQMLMFRVHALTSAVHNINEIVTIVQANHVPFYQKFLGFELYSENPYLAREWSNMELHLLGIGRDECMKMAVKRGMPVVNKDDMMRYVSCLHIPKYRSNKLAA